MERGSSGETGGDYYMSCADLGWKCANVYLECLKKSTGKVPGSAVTSGIWIHHLPVSTRPWQLSANEWFSLVSHAAGLFLLETTLHEWSLSKKKLTILDTIVLHTGVTSQRAWMLGSGSPNKKSANWFGSED